MAQELARKDPGRTADLDLRRLSRRQPRSGRRLKGKCRNRGAYVSESDFFEADWQHSYWGSNYARLATVKKKYDPTGLFFVHNGVGSEEWNTDGFIKL